MFTSSDYYLELIDRLIDQKHLLKHPFYRAWSCGKLSKECLLQYAIEYYKHVLAFPTYLSALHAHTEESDTRRHILQNLVDEEAGHPNHPELWRAFTVKLGASDEELDETPPSPAIAGLIATFRDLCQKGSVAQGIASLYAYESQIPAVCYSKIDGLRCHYGMNEPSSFEYFTVHIHADEEHAAVERRLLGQYLTADNGTEVLMAVDRTLDALNLFLTSLCDRYQVAA